MPAQKYNTMDESHHESLESRSAIANLDRRFIPGPEFLDDFISTAPHDRIAIEYQDAEGRTSSIAYHQLQLASSNLAAQIQQATEHGKDYTIPVILPQQPLLYVAYLAVLKCGAAFCPILPDTPEERLKFILEDVQADIVLGEQCMLETFTKIAPSTKYLAVTEKDLFSISNHHTKVRRVRRKRSDTAYVMYTSGSTGKPKGVLISHAAVCQSLLAHDEHIPSFARFMQFAAPTFDVSMFEIFFPWHRGSTLVCCERNRMLADLPGIINAMHVDAVELTPSVATTLLRRRSAVPGLKLLLTIGEMLTPHVVSEFGGSKSEASILFAMYGPTEAAIHCTILPRMPSSTSVRSIGEPLSTVTAFVLEESSSHGHPRILEYDEVGELAIAGQLADGYLNRADETAAAFVDHDRYGRIYRTGDRAAMTADGQIQIMGRISSGQVKLRGQRVELGEVETTASQTDGVDLAIAMVIDESLILFCSGDSDLQVNAIQRRCKAWLPRHMRPNDIVLPEGGFPRLSSGKVDRKGLEELYKSNVTRVTASESAISTTEAKLVRIISRELGTTIQTAMPLSTFGLDSLSAIRVVSRLRDEFPSITTLHLLDADSVSELARTLDTTWTQRSDAFIDDHVEEMSRWQELGRAALQQHSICDMVPDIDTFWPCSRTQIEMLSDTIQDSTSYMNRIVLSLSHTVSIDAVVQALEDIAAQNPILRAGFLATDDADMPFLHVIKRKLFIHQADLSLLHPFQIRRTSSPLSVEVLIHHAVYDGWSWDIVMADLNKCLRCEDLQARPSFLNFVLHQRREFKYHNEQDLNQWLSHLRQLEAIPFPNLCTSDSAHNRSTRGRYSTTIETSHSALSHLAKRLNVNKPSIVHAALTILLSTIMDNTNVATGLVVAGRNTSLPRSEDIIGSCLLTLPHLTQLSECVTLRDLIMLVYYGHMHCMRHPAVTLGQIKSALALEADEKLFDVLFVWQESLYSESSADDLVTTPKTQDALNFGLVFEVEPRDDSLLVKTTYDTSKLSAQQIEIIHDQFDYLVSHTVSQPELPLRNVWHSTPATLLSMSNPHIKQSVPNHTRLTAIYEHAQSSPDRIAVDFVTNFDTTTRSIQREKLTYQQLYSRSMNAAKILVYEHQLKNDDVVVLVAYKSVDLYIAICAVITAGLAYLCIDPETPRARMAEMLCQVKARILVTDLTDISLVNCNVHVEVVGLKDLVTTEHDSDRTFRPSSKSSDLAYIVFTSGSTGVPKGVLITRQNLFSNIGHLAQFYPHKPSSRLLQSCSTAFDVSVFEIFWTWHCGMTLCSANNDVLYRDIEAFIDAIDVTHLSMTPSVAALVDPVKVPKVKFLVCAGEPMSAKVFNSWAVRGLHQGYGPSETTNICNVRDYQQGRAPINNVGAAFPNTSIFVCARVAHANPLTTDDLKLVPQGAVGELWIAGAQVGRGYTDPELTRRSWLEHPSYGRLYKSGDIGRLLADGSVVVLGREDDQTKIRGQRVELNEINKQILCSGIVADAYTFIRSHSGRNSLVSTWVKAKSNSSGDDVAIRMLYEYLRSVLPSYMVPEILLPLRQIPLTHQGKIDKSAIIDILAKMSTEQQARFGDQDRSVNEGKNLDEEEQKMATALSRATSMTSQDINKHAPFSSYGIDSIRAISFAQHLRKSGFESIEVSSIMKHNTIRKLSTFSKRRHNRPQRGLSSTKAAKTIHSAVMQSVKSQLQDNGFEVEQILPCTSLQVAMLSSHETSSHGAYINHVVYGLEVDPDLIKNAFSSMVQRHQLLRTVFALTEAPEHPFVQAVLHQYEVPWRSVLNASIDEMGSPLKRPSYSLQLRQVDTSFELHLFMHHVLYDAEALSHLQTEVEALCRGEQLPPAVSFSNYLDFMVNTDRNAANDFWEATLRGSKSCKLSRCGFESTSTVQTVISKSRVSNMTYHHLQSRMKQLSTTLLALAQASLSRLLSAYTGTADVCFGSVFSGRNVSVDGVKRIVGPCFNTLPTRVRLGHKIRNTDLCQTLQTYNADVLPFQATSLRELSKQHSSDGLSLFDVLLLVQTEGIKLDTSVWRLIAEEGQMDFPFIFEICPSGGKDKIVIKLHSTLPGSSSIHDSLLENFLRILDDTVSNPQRSAATLDNFLHDLPRRKVNGNSKAHLNENANDSDGEQSIWTGSHIAETLHSCITAFTRNDLNTANSSTTIFELGLDSINAVQLASRLRAHGYKIQAGTILEEPQLGRIIECCINEGAVGDEPVATSSQFSLEAFDTKHRNSILTPFNLRSADVVAVWPCTPTQAGILSEYLRSDGSLYYNTLILRLGLGTDLKRLRSAWQAAVDRHSMLRTGFAEAGDAQFPFAMVVHARHPASKFWFNHVSQISTETENSQTNQVNDCSPPWRIEVETHACTSYLKIHMLHALYDAQSVQLLLRDVAKFYAEGIIPERSSIENTLRYILSNVQLQDADKDFWIGLRDTVQPTKFPDLNILRDLPSKLEVRSLGLRRTLTQINERCARTGCSLSTVCQMVWAKLLSAYTGQKTVTFGTILSGRIFEDENLANSVFPCINTLPLIVDTSSDDKSLIQQVQKLNARLQKHQHVPLSSVKRTLGVDQELFDTIIVLQGRTEDDDYQALWQIESDTASAEYAVSLEIVPHQDSLTLRITFNQKCLPPEHSSILLRQFKQLLYDALGFDGSYGAVSGPLHSLLPPKMPLFPSNSELLHELTLASAKRNPNKVALEFVEEMQNDKPVRRTWRYRDVAEQATRTANLLHSHGAATGDLVAVCFEKRPEASFVLLGVLMAGCAYVAIDPTAPSSRQDFILRDAGCRIVLTQTVLEDSFKSLEAKPTVLCIDDDEILRRQSSLQPRLTRPVSGNDTCYCLYTSGTTGTPKGCLISHKSAVQAMHSFSKIFEGYWADDSRWLQFAGYHFDVSVLEHFWTWHQGMCVTVAPRDLLFEDLPGTISKLGITHLDLTPSLARLLTPKAVPSLCNGVFIVGGEPVRPEILDTWGDAACLYNFYGPSEVTMGCTVHPRVAKNVKPTNIGQQWDNVGTHVLEPGTEKPVLLGAIGELCLSGVLVGKGYLNRPDLTAEKFATISSTGERIYHSGDLVRMLHDHSFDFIGRIDDQVKLRGQRLEIGEINRAILDSTDTFTDAATLVLKRTGQEKEHLVTFLTQAKSTKKTSQTPSFITDQQQVAQIPAIRSRLSDRIPSYMVPTYCIVVDFLPLTVNNKLDAKVLRALYEASSLHRIRQQQGLQESPAVAGQRTYKDIRDVVASFLQINADDIEPSSSLFQLGVDSISAIALVRTLRNAGYNNVTVASLLKRPTLTDLSAFWTKGQSLDGTLLDLDLEMARRTIRDFAGKHEQIVVRALGADRQEIENVAPCTPLQSGMISKLMSSDAKFPPYLMRFVYQLETGTDLRRLENAWTQLLARYDILRTRFVPTEDGYAQVILKQAKAPFNVDYGMEFFEHDPLKTVNDAFQSWSKSIRLLGKECPFQVWYTQMKQSEVIYMSLFIFHGIYDGTTLPLLLSELQKLYDKASEVDNQAPQLFEALPHGPLLQRADAPNFWRCQLPCTQLLGLNTPPEGNSIHKTHKRFSSTTIRDVCSSLSVTLQAVFHAAWLLTLARNFGVNPTIGIVLSGRSIELENADKIVGPMFNTLPFMVADLQPSSSLAGLIKACHAKHADILPYQHSSLSSVKKWIKANPTRQLFDSLLVYQGASLQASHIRWQEIHSESVADYPLNIEIEEVSRGMYAATIIAYDACVNEEGVNVLMDIIQEVISQIHNASNTSLPDCFFSSEDAIHDQDTRRTVEGTETETQSWTSKMKIVRSEIARLAGLEESAISQTTPTIFQLGLDSVDALKLGTRLKNKGVRLPISKILQHPTVAGIAEQASTEYFSRSVNNDDNLPRDDFEEICRSKGLNPARFEAILPVTPMQRGLLVDFKKYFHVVVAEIDASIDVGTFIRAVNATVNDLSVLRTTLLLNDDGQSTAGFLQAVAKPRRGGRQPQISHRVAGLEGLKHYARDIEQSAELDNSRPATSVVSCADGRNYFVLALSHASYDAWSLRLLLNHIQQRYYGRISDDNDTHIVMQYLQNLRSSMASPSTTNFWSDQLRSFTSTLVESKGGHVALLKHRTSAVALNLVHNTCKRLGITVQSLGLAVWSLVLMNFTKQVDVGFGLVVSGRTDEGTQRLVFPTFNTVIFRPDIKLNSSQNHTLRKVHELAVALYEYQQYPLSEALTLIGSRSPEAFNTLFTFQRTPELQEAAESFLREVDLGNGNISPPYAINIEMEEKNEGILWTVATQAGVMSSKDLDETFNMLDHILDRLTDTEDEPIFLTSNDTVSICGLPVVGLSESYSKPIGANQENQQNLEPDDESWSTAETEIRKVFSKVANISEDEITKHTSLFHLGLDSVSAIKLSKLLRDAGFKVPVSIILIGQTVSRIAQSAQSARPAARDKGDADRQIPANDKRFAENFEQELSEVGIALNEVENVLPATAGQAYMLDIWRASSGRLFYATFSFTISLCKEETFQQAFCALVKLTPLLRTTFLTNNGSYYQVILNADSQQRAPQHIGVQQADKDLLVALHIHHALYDAVSLGIMVDNLQRLCRQEQIQSHIDFQSFVDLTASNNEQSEPFWVKYLEGAGLQAQSRGGTYQAARTELFVPEVMPTRAVEQLARREGLSFQSILFAAVARAFASLRDPRPRNTMAMGMYLANRSLDLEGLPDLVAPTFTVLPLIVNIGEDVLLIEAARKVQSDLQEISRAENCGVSLRQIHAWTGVKLDCYVNFLRLPDRDIANLGLALDNEGNGGGLVIKHAQGEDREKAKARIRAEDSPSPFVGGIEAQEEDVEWCVPALDLEAKVESNGQLAMGMFAPADMFGKEEVEGLIKEIKEMLNGLVPEA